MTYTPPEQPGQPSGGYQPERPSQPSGYQPEQSGYQPEQAGYQPEQAGYQPEQAGYQPEQAGYQPYQPAQSQYGYGAEQSTKKTLSMWGLILGISSIVIPIWINAIAGGVLSGIGIAKEPAGKTMAIWGIVTSALGFIWAFIFWPLLITVIFAAALSAEYGY